MTPTEGKIERAFVRWCDKLKIPCEKITVGKRGWPDRAVLLPKGRVLWIEFKTTEGVLSHQQEFVHRKLRKAGHTVVVCRSLEEAIKATEEFDDGRN